MLRPEPPARTTRCRLAVACAWLLLASAGGLHAQQCVNPANPNCDFYSRCMEQTCKCGFEKPGYALSYGKKYCGRFLAESAFSPSGARWRDATLRCLQEKLVSALPTNAARCDCGKLRDVAFASHVACYTQPGNSVCDLPAGDVLKVKDLVDNSDRSDVAGLKTILQVASRCVTANGSNAWKIVKAYVSQKLHGS